MPRRVEGRRGQVPAGAVLVDRSTRYGNPWVVRRTLLFDAYGGEGEQWVWRVFNADSGVFERDFEDEVDACRWAVMLFEQWVFPVRDLDVSGLRGRDLACRCRVGLPCHADFLLSIAN